MTRIPPELMEPLGDAIGEAFEPAQLDLILVRTTGKRLFKEYVAEKQPHNEIAYELIKRLDELGFHRVVLTHILLVRPQDNALRDIIGRACPEALEALPSTASQVNDIISGTDNLKLRLDQDAVRGVVVETQSELGEVAGSLVILDIYKNLHDCLHQLQIKQFHSLRAAARSFSADALRMETLREYQSQLRSKCLAIGEQIDRLPDKHSQQPMERIWYTDLDDAVRRFQTGIDKRSKEETLLALRDIRGIMRRVPQRLNEQIFATAAAIPLDIFSTALRKAADALAPQNAEIEKAHAALQIVRPTINARVVEHKKWQDADKSISELDELFEREHPEQEDEFLPYWSDAKKRVRELAELGPEQEWSINTSKYSDAVDDELAREVDDGNLKRAFSDYRHETRFRFLVVDTTLKSDCASLVKISDPLKAMLARLDHA